MSETHNYCDAPNGPCLDRSAYEAKFKAAQKALIHVYYVSINKEGDEPESVLSAVNILLNRALIDLAERKD